MKTNTTCLIVSPQYNAFQHPCLNNVPNYVALLRRVLGEGQHVFHMLQGEVNKRIVMDTFRSAITVSDHVVVVLLGLYDGAALLLSDGEHIEKEEICATAARHGFQGSSLSHSGSSDELWLEFTPIGQKCTF